MAHRHGQAMGVFDGDRIAQKKLALSLAERLAAEHADGEARQQESSRAYRNSSEYYLLSHCRLIAVLAVLLILSGISAMWLMVCVRVETRERDAALRTVEKYTAEDMLDDNIRAAVKRATDVRNGDILFNALCRMVTDLPLVQIVGAYEQTFREAWKDAMRQHVFVGFLCVLMVATVMGSFAALFYFTCNRRAWRPTPPQHDD